ncbi:MAG: TIGR01777 family oxidoreductase [Deltaproteobacteria bacterium]|nr:TIGR01777 family oxidoreductase [Deltaproteobacteria bacterium]
MKIVVTGATGFVGSAVCSYLRSLNHTIVGIGRRNVHPLQGSSGFQYIHADTSMAGGWQNQISNADAVVNLAGESILRRWSGDARTRIWDSRVKTTKNVTNAMGRTQTLLSFSATGYFGDRGPEELTEESARGTGFLSDLCAAWEDAATHAPGDSRIVICRLGVVLGNGGALEKMLPVFKLGMGGRLGSGRQWFPWIHLEDVLGGIHFLLRTPAVTGPVHLVSPNPLINRAFTETLGNELGVPTVAVVPKMVLSMLFGEASCVLLDSQRVIPQKLTASGFNFRYPAIQAALHQIVAE